MVEATRLPVLSLIKSAQQQHGLRQGDYERYQQYISRKLRRMRKSLHFQQGTRSKVVPKKITADITDPRFIMLAIFEIERSWAYSMQLKSKSNTELRKRFQMVSRLRKAVSRAEYLCNLVDGLTIIDAQAKLEIRAYRHWIEGVLYFERQDWVNAKETFESAKAIYEVLVQMVDEDNGEIYKSRLEEFWPQICYCDYNIGDETAAENLQRLRTQTKSGSSILAEMQLDELLLQAKANQASQVTSVQWFDKTIPVKSEKAKLAVLTMKESMGELKQANSSQAKLAIFESVLKSCVEAIAFTQDELRAALAAEASIEKNNVTTTANVNVGISTSSQTFSSEKTTKLQILHTYLQYLKLFTTINRTVVYIDVALGLGDKAFVRNGIATSSYTKPQEVARFYDTLVQNFQELATLPFLNQEHSSLMDLSHAKLAAYKSFRCYYLALTYSHAKKQQECLSLLARAKEHAEKAYSAFDPRTSTWNDEEMERSPGHSPDQLLKLLILLIQQVDAEDLTCRAGCILDTLESNEITGSSGPADQLELANQPLIDRLDSFMDEKSTEKSFTLLANPFIELPPKFEPVPVKPWFFDLALNHIKFPSLFKSETEEESSGLTGLMRGWLWGGSKEKK